MLAESYTDFLKLVSKTSSNAYMLLTIDPYKMDANPRPVERALDMLSDDSVEKLSHGGVVIVFDTIGEAIDVYHAIDQSIKQIPNIELAISIYYEGFNLLNITQDNDLPFPAEFAAASHALM